MFRYTPQHLEFLTAGYQLLTASQLTKAFNKRFKIKKTVVQIKGILGRMKIKSNRDCKFKKGAISWNTGTKGLTTRNKKSFKKGNIPPNIKPVGTERICPKDGFISIKIKEKCPYTGFKTRFKHKHVYLWEQANGKVPAGHVIAFKDGNKSNCCLENLILITRAELLCLNRKDYRNTPDKLKPSVLALSKLEVKTWEKERCNQGK